jgi:hypothetical protein
VPILSGWTEILYDGAKGDQLTPKSGLGASGSFVGPSAPN